MITMDSTALNELIEERAEQKHREYLDRFNEAFGFDCDQQYGDYRVRVYHPDRGDTMHLTVTKDSFIVLEDQKIVDGVKEVIVRDLDQDNYPEIYIIDQSSGSAGYEFLSIYETSGDSIEGGDLKLLYGPYHWYLTEKWLIHEHWLETSDGCCAGIEFTYFELKNNRFVLVDRQNYFFGDRKEEDVVNRSNDFEE